MSSSEIADEEQGYTLATGAPKKPTRADFERLLLDDAVPIEDACRIKWGWGVEEHRGGDASKPFAGDRLTEIHSEGLDSLNYLPGLMEELGEIPEAHECLEEMRAAAERLVRGARILNAIRGARLLAKNGQE